jgi:protein TonB
MMRAKSDGSAEVEFVVDTKGDVRDAKAVHSTDPEFEAPSIEAVNHWKFAPGQKDNQVVNTRMRVTLNYTMKND